MPIGDQHKRRELERLLSSASDEGDFAAVAPEIESLLLDDPGLQDDYCRWTALHHLLQQEFPAADSQASPPAALARTSRRSGRTTLMGRGRFARRPAAIAASCALLTLAAYWSANGLGRSSIAQSGPGSRSAAAAGAGVGSRGPAAESTTSAAAANRRVWTTVAHGVWGQLRLTPAVNQVPSSRPLGKGPLRMEDVNHRAARGYLVPVPPGASVELIVHAAADIENALVIIELDAQGLPTGRRFSFNNAAPHSAAARAREGRLGSWTDHNATPEMRYFLLVGLHKLLEETPTAATERSGNATDQPSASAPRAADVAEDRWYVSDFQTLLNSPDLIHLGWDDSGWISEASWPRDALHRDKDYDDIAVTVRIADQQRRATPPVQTIRTLPETDPEEFADEVGPHDFRFAVPPHTTVILRASAEASWPNKLALLDADNRALWWSCDNVLPSAHRRTPQRTYSGGIGAFAVCNDTDEPKAFYLVARHRGVDQSWAATQFRAACDNELFWSVGYEDSVQDSDWNDLRVDLHWMAN